MRLSERMEGGTLRQHLQQLHAQTGQLDPELAEELPAEAAALWGAYLQLSASRARGFGPSAITYVEIEAWQRLQGVQLTPWELDTLTAMDLAAMAEQGKQGAKQ
jgi:hypothetical protein